MAATWVFLALALAALAVALYERLRDGRLGADASDAELVDWLRLRLLFLHPAVREIPVDVGRCAFCQNRARITVRLRDPRGAVYPREDLLYVYVHELAHVLAEPEDEEHGPAFERAFDALRRRAEAAGLFPAGYVVSPSYTSGCTDD